MYTEGGPGNNFEMGKLTEVDLKIQQFVIASITLALA